MSLNILYQSDDNYAPYMGVSICSLFENNKNEESIKIYIIDICLYYKKVKDTCQQNKKQISIIN